MSRPGYIVATVFGWSLFDPDGCLVCSATERADLMAYVEANDLPLIEEAPVADFMAWVRAAHDQEVARAGDNPPAWRPPREIAEEPPYRR